MGLSDRELRMLQQFRAMAEAADRTAASTAAMARSGERLAAAFRHVSKRYAMGGLVPQPYPAEPEPPVALGSVTGYRWWTLPAPDWRTFPSQAEENWPHGRLHGMQGDWRPGVNTAVCRPASPGGQPPHDPELAPYRGCSCGFWAMWQPAGQPAVSRAGSVQIFGAIKGWGRFRRGQHGFRAGKARILALFPAFTLLPYVDDGVTAGAVTADDPRVLPPGWHEVTTPERARHAHKVRTLRNGKKLLLPDDVTDDQAELADAHAEAWMATLGVRLEEDYGVRVFETRDALLAEFPPDPVYGTAPSCKYCDGTDTPAGHAKDCVHFWYPRT